ncbi:hypothetical protein ABK040_014466, partial [Willaertia magna]
YPHLRKCLYNYEEKVELVHTPYKPNTSTIPPPTLLPPLNSQSEEPYFSLSRREELQPSKKKLKKSTDKSGELCSVDGCTEKCNKKKYSVQLNCGNYNLLYCKSDHFASVNCRIKITKDINACLADAKDKIDLETDENKKKINETLTNLRCYRCDNFTLSLEQYKCANPQCNEGNLVKCDNSLILRPGNSKSTKKFYFCSKLCKDDEIQSDYENLSQQLNVGIKTIYNNEHISDLTGINKNQFHQLLNIFESEISCLTLNEGKLKQYQGRSRNLSYAEQLLMFLVWIRHYVSNSFLSWMFGIAKGKVSIYNISSLNCLYNLFKTKLEIMLPYNIREKFIVNFNGASFSVLFDGSEQQISVSKEKNIEQVTYSGKKKLHTFTKLVACSPNGFIYFISSSYAGSKNDQQIYNMEENHIHTSLKAHEFIGANKGFTGVYSYWKNTIIPYLSSDDLLTVEEKTFNNEFAHYRIVIENVFSNFKKFKIYQYVFRSKTKNLDKALQLHHKVWIIVGGLLNSFRMPLR